MSIQDAPGGSAALSTVLVTVLVGLEDKIEGYHSQYGDDTILVAAADRLAVCQWLKDHPVLGFDLLMDSTAVDWPEDELRFEVVDHLFSTTGHHRLRLKCRVSEDSPSLPSLTPLFGSANWMERETWDMYGIEFDGHPDLRRILLYPEFKGFPLRKDYPKLKAHPLFEARYPGVRETSAIIHPKPGETEPRNDP